MKDLPEVIARASEQLRQAQDFASRGTMVLARDAVKEAREILEGSDVALECAGLRCCEVAPLWQMEVIDNRAFCLKCAPEIKAEIAFEAEERRREEQLASRVDWGSDLRRDGHL